MESVRGLNARIHLANARILEGIGFNEEAEDEYSLANQFAISQGIGDYKHSVPQPKLFLNEHILIEGYEDGLSFSALNEEMDHCSNCQDGTGNPCSIHG